VWKAALASAGSTARENRFRDRRRYHVERSSMNLPIARAAASASTSRRSALDVRPDELSGDAVIALLAFAMGVRNATIRRLGVPDLTTTVLTMTLTGLAAESPPAGGSGSGSAQEDRRCACDVHRGACRSAAG